MKQKITTYRTDHLKDGRFIHVKYVKPQKIIEDLHFSFSKAVKDDLKNSLPGEIGLLLFSKTVNVKGGEK